MITSQQIAASIERRLTELSREIAQLDAARRALVSENGSGSRSEVPRRSRGRARRQNAKPRPDASARAASARGSRRRQTVPLSGQELEPLLAGSAGLSTTDMATRAGADRERVLSLLRELEAGGRVRRSGVRRATRWHAITDGDRIAQRAPHLGSQARGSVHSVIDD